MKMFVTATNFSFDCPARLSLNCVYSFLCPNGTIFNQEYFICDWWFNFDCSSAEGLYSLNEDIAAEREAVSASQANGNQGSGSNNSPSYSSPAQAQYGSGK